MMTIILTLLLSVVTLCASFGAPASNYYSWYAPEVVDEVCTHLARNEYCAFLDYNGDSSLTMADAVSIARRYQENLKFGNEITIGTEEVEAIISENYSVPCIYWEFSEVNGKITRQYSVTTDCIIQAKIYFEFEDYSSETMTIEIDPFKEAAFVIS